MTLEKFPIQDARTHPFFIVYKGFSRKHNLTWKAILAYYALLESSSADIAKCRHTSIEKLSMLVGVSITTMKEGLRELLAKKLIRRKTRISTNENGKRITLPNEYILLDPTPKDPI